MSHIVVIPTLNEAKHIANILNVANSAAMPATEGEEPSLVIVADGGSTDGTLDIVDAHARDAPWIRRLDNPARIQSAGINLAVATFGSGRDYLIRLDAHAGYPEGYIKSLLATAEETGATSVVVPMKAVAETCFQAAVAAAQNSRLGTGGAAHRMAASSGWVDHGHHALMRLDAYHASGGYNAALATNEDAELDTRLLALGGKIWLSAENEILYFPRGSTSALWKQYFRYGGGRATTLRLHGMRPKLRQLLPILILPVVAICLLAPAVPIMALPAVAWAALCLGYGIALGVRNRSWCAAAAGWPAMVMHLAWSCGYWHDQLATARTHPRPPST